MYELKSVFFSAFFFLPTPFLGRGVVRIQRFFMTSVGCRQGTVRHLSNQERSCQRPGVQPQVFEGKNWKTDILWQSTAVKLKKPWIRLNSDCGLKPWRNSSKRQRRKNSDHLESLPLDMCLKHKMFCFLRKWMCTNQVGTSWSKAWCSWNVGVNLWKFEVVSPHSTVALSAWWHRIDIDW